MRSEIEIDDDLLAEALEVTGAKTKQEVVELGPRALIRVGRQGPIRRFRGELAWRGDLDAMRSD